MTDVCLPDCMMPDGGQCCAGYTKQRHRIEVLEAVLAQIAELTNASKNTTCNTCRKAGVVARAALAPGTDK